VAAVLKLTTSRRLRRWIDPDWLPFPTLNTDPAVVDQMGDIFTFTTVLNRRSWAVMKRIGMKRHDDFDDPAAGAGHRLRRHCLYRLTRVEWQQV